MREAFTTPSGISVRFTRRQAVLRLPAVLGLANYDDLCDSSRRLLDDGVPAMVLDLTGCDYCDPSTMEAILRVHIHASELATPLSLRLPPSGTVPRVCATTGVSRVVPVEAPETAAPPTPLPHHHGRFRR
ncbi:STAS domain-containing protein [Actinomadura sp. NPDC048032]|uniref:STAS domain-containing protein n=1 Tax=Actinomadura sp. NPDC048032 TaxID=3155747 RepID=UPI0033E65A4E